MSEMTFGGEAGAKALDELTIAQLRQYAKLYNVVVEKTATKQDIINALQAKMKSKQVLKVADESKAPPPGRWRIVLQKDPTIGAKAGSRPVPVFVNGYRCDIPRGIAVDVPEKVVRLLETCKHPQVVDDPERSGYSKIELLPSYPFQVLDKTEGPDPAPGFEKIKEASYRPRERFWQLFDYWPSKAQLREAQEAGLVSLRSGEFLDDGKRKPLKEIDA